MTRVKAQDHPRSRQRAASYRAEFNQEIEQRIAQLRERISQVRDLTVDGFPYRDSERVRLELQIRQSIRQAFGDGSPEFQQHQYFRLKIGTEPEIQGTVSMLHELITRLERQKFDLPESTQTGNPEPTRPAGPASSSADLAPSPNGQPAGSPGDRPMGSQRPRHDGTDMLLRDTHPEPSDPADRSPLGTIRKLCAGFHAVARQLRQRHDDRPTLDVEDEHDVQDLVHALLRLEFGEILTDHWTPSYAGGAERTTFLLVPERIALVIKRTRPGVGGRDIKMQLDMDAQRYCGRPDCAVLFCFVYDPEGRIANPREFEAALFQEREAGTIAVQISP